jgi:hypothetical protein
LQSNDKFLLKHISKFNFYKQLNVIYYSLIRDKEKGILKVVISITTFDFPLAGLSSRIRALIALVVSTRPICIIFLLPRRLKVPQSSNYFRSRCPMDNEKNFFNFLLKSIQFRTSQRSVGKVIFIFLQNSLASKKYSLV